MVIGSHKRMIVYNKTGKRCSICGRSSDLTCVCFIPEWTRIVNDDTDNMVPLCDDCRIKRGKNFIEIGALKYLPKLYIEQLLRYYKSVSMYLYKYIRLYAHRRVGNEVDLSKTLLIMQSYDLLLRENEDEFDWEHL